MRKRSNDDYHKLKQLKDKARKERHDEKTSFIMEYEPKEQNHSEKIDPFLVMSLFGVYLKAKRHTSMYGKPKRK